MWDTAPHGSIALGYLEINYVVIVHVCPISEQIVVMFASELKPMDSLYSFTILYLHMCSKRRICLKLHLGRVISYAYVIAYGWSCWIALCVACSD